MTEIHIPPEVVEAGAKADYELWRDQNEVRAYTLAWGDLAEDERQSHRDSARAAITAALAAWVQSGMAKKAFAYPVDRQPDRWHSDTACIGDDDETSFPVLIIRTEAST